MKFIQRIVKYYDGKGYFCPRCKEQVYIWTLTNRKNQYIQTSYCVHCGQKLNFDKSRKW